MAAHQTFSTKWADMKEGSVRADEKSLFVEPGREPATQRQLNLYYYFQFVRSILEARGAKRVLEIGCGRGTLSLYLAMYMGLDVGLLDDAPDAIEVAKRTFAAYEVTAEYYVQDALHTTLPSESYEAVVSIGLAEHLDTVTELFQEQYRLLRPGGVMISLNIPKKFSVQKLNTVMRFIKKIIGKYPGEVQSDYYRNQFSPEEYAAFAKKVGFDATAVTYVCPFPIYTPVTLSTDKKITKLRKAILGIRSLFQQYPYKTNALMAQAHFLVAYKK